MKCSDCQHWEKVSEYIRKSDGRAVSHGNCQLTNGESFEPLYPQSRAFAMGDKGMGAMLYCDEDFGCVQFEAKP